MDIKINVAFRSIKKWRDSKSRSDHLLDRMQSRGIGIEQIRDALQKGAKSIRKNGSIVSEYRWFRIVYREFRVKNIRKVYPITVMEV